MDKMSEASLRFWIIEYRLAAQDRARKDPQYYAKKAEELEQTLAKLLNNCTLQNRKLSC